MMYSTCLIGHGSPTLPGMIEPFAASTTCRNCSGLYGEFERTCLVYAASSAPVGSSTNETWPWSRPVGWSNPMPPTLRGAAPFDGAFGPMLSRPLPVPTNSVLPLLATLVGYQPVGTKPTTVLTFPLA